MKMSLPLTLCCFASLAQAAAPPEQSLSVSVVAYRVPEEVLVELGFDWLVGTSSEESVAGEVRLRGVLLPSQNGMIQRGLGLANGAEREVPEVRGDGPKWTIDAPWDATRKFEWVVEPQEGGARVSANGPSVFVSETQGNVVVFVSKAGANVEIYFVRISFAGAVPAPAVTPHEPQIEVNVTVVQIPETAFAAAAGELEKAIVAGDREILAGYQDAGLTLIPTPTVSTRSGELAMISIVREYRFPTAFRRDSDGKIAPGDFETMNLGIQTSLRPIWEDGTVRLDGKFVLRSFEGLERGPGGIFLPAFQSTEAYLAFEVKSGGACGVWLPGVRTFRGVANEGIPSAMEMMPADYARSAASNEPEGRFKIGLMLSAGKVVPRAPVSPWLRIDVKAYDVSRASMENPSESPDRGSSRNADHHSVAAVFDANEPVPEGAEKLQTVEIADETFSFETPRGWKGTLRRESRESTVTIEFQRASRIEEEAGTTSVTTLSFNPGDKILMRHPASGEAILLEILERRASGD